MPLNVVEQLMGKKKNLLLEFIWFLTTFTLPKLKPNVKGKRSEGIQDVQET